MVVFSVVIVFLYSQRHRKGAEQSKVPKSCESLGTPEIPGCRHILEDLRSPSSRTLLSLCGEQFVWGTKSSLCPGTVPMQIRSGID